MRQLVLIGFLFVSGHCFSADRYWVGGGSSANWAATGNTNWGTASGVQDNATVPGSSDAVIFDGAGVGGNTIATVSANITVLSLTFTTGYTATVTINNAVVLTVAGNFTDRPEHNWSVSGTGSMTISASSTITSNGKTFPGPVSFSGASTTKTLSGNWIISGTLTISGNSLVINWTTNESISCAGLTMTNSLASGTAKIILTGGTWQSGGTVINNLDIQGNVTISAGVAFNTKTLTYISGAITTTNSTLTIAAPTTLNTNGISWNNITLTSGATTVTINSLLTITGTLTFPVSSGITFAGSAGWTCSTLTNASNSGTTITLVNGVTYTITTAFNAFNSRIGAILLFTSDHASNKAILTLNQGATCNVLANFTRIDASAGRTIWTFNGTITTCTNINQFKDIIPVSSTFVQ